RNVSSETMVSEIFFALTFLGLIQSPQKVGDELDAPTTARMQQRAEELQARMMQLLLEIEQREQEHSWAHVGTLLLSLLQHWHFWVLTGEIVLFFVLCHTLMKFCRERRRGTKKGVSGRKDDDDSEEDPRDILDARRVVIECLQRPVRDLEGTGKVVEELVNNLLAACQGLPRNKFMPRLQAPIAVGSASGPTERDTIYRLLVPLNPPPGHAFQLELGTKGERLARNSCLRVELQCMCTREWMLGDVLCFLHRPEHELKNQDPSLLDTLCCGSYLDVRKTAKWFQELVAEAWGAVPQAAQLQLTMLPSTRFCKFLLTSASSDTLSIELMLGVKQDHSDTYLTFQWPQSCAVPEMLFRKHLGMLGTPSTSDISDSGGSNCTPSGATALLPVLAPPAGQGEQLSTLLSAACCRCAAWSLKGGLVQRKANHALGARRLPSQSKRFLNSCPRV
uniref:Uncharacterized protein n=1 Tax=Cairina moschata TaxID=8855 RepID=A0A8C3CDZ0_CAIMO